MLTLKEKIMLALLEKKECSRKEIAGLCRVVPSQVSRIIKKMIKDRDVEKNKRYVICSGRFNDFYSLTADGIFNAKEIKEKVGDIKIKVKDKGKLMEKRINEINMNILDVVTHVSNNVFEPEKLRKKFVLSESIPKFRYFFGREKEINEIKDFLRSESKMLVIKGVAGIGKTTLGGKIASEYNGNIFWYRFNEWTTLQDAVRSIGNFLKKIGKNTLDSYVNSDKQFGIGEVSIILEKDMNNVLVFFDDCHHAKEEVVLFFKSLLSVLDKKNDVKIIMFGRSIPLFYDRRDVVLKKRVKEIGIGGLDENSGKKLLEHRKIDDGSIDDILRNLKGHPLFLELASGNAKGEIDRYLSEEIFARLGENEKDALALASVFRYPFPFDVFSESGIDYSVVESLIERSLLKPDFFVHDLIRDFVYPRLTKEQKIRYHNTAGSYYESNEDWIECVHHFTIAEPEKATSIAVGKGAQLIRTGHVDDFLSMLNKLDGYGQQNELLLLKGDIFDIKGEWDKAMECYEKVLKIANGKKDEGLLAKCYLGIGRLQEKKSEWDIAIKNFNRCLNISKKICNLEGLAGAYHGIGYVCMRIGELNNALNNHNKSIEYYKKINNASGIGKAYTAIGLTYMNKGEYAKAITHYNKALNIFEKLGDNYEIVRIYNNIGASYGQDGKENKAINYYEKQIDVAEEIGDVRGLAYGLIGLSYDYNKVGSSDKAIGCLEKSMPMIKRLGDKHLLLSAYESFGVIYHNNKNWKKSIEYFNKAIKISEQIKSLDYTADTYYEYAKMYKSKYDDINAKKQFENALKYYEKLGNKEKIKEVENELLELEKGLRKCQKTRIKRKALKHSGKN